MATLPLLSAETRCDTHWCEALVQSSEDAIISKTLDGIVTSWNPKAEAMFGYSADEMIGQSLLRLFPPERVDEERMILERLRRGEAVRHFQTVRLRRDGRALDVSVTISPVRDVRGRIVGASKIVRDISAETAQLRSLRESELRYRGVVDASPDGFLMVAPNGRIIRANPAYCRMSGYDPSDLLDRHIAELSAEFTPQQIDARIADIAQAGGRRFATQHRRKDGSVWPAEVTANLVPELGELFVFVRDLTELRALEAERARSEQVIRDMAFHDPLTRLPNRRLLLDRLAQTLAACTRACTYGALLFIDMDHFKALNDTHGHHAGDAFLVEVAARLSAAVRAEDTVARLGGDEFVVMLVGLGIEPATAAEHARTAADKLCAALAAPYALDDLRHASAASIGATLFGLPGDTPQAVLRRADTAMYRAKSAGGNGVRMIDKAEAA